MNQLMASCESWDQLTQVDKERAVEAVLSLYRVKENVAVMKPAAFYAQRADETLLTNSDLKKLNLPALVRLLAIMEYDYFNGQNKDELAKKLLGDKMYEANKKRLQLQTT